MKSILFFFLILILHCSGSESVKQNEPSKKSYHGKGETVIV